jgi:hypothetical protein
MASEPSCQHCGAAIEPNTHFCAECGKAVAAPAQPVPKTTMLGAAGLVVPPPPADDAGRTTAAGISQPARGAMGRTMIGIPLSPLQPPPDAQPPRPAPSAAKVTAKTMLGLPLPVRPDAVPPPASSGSPAPHEAGAGPDPRHARTLVGAPEALADTDPLRVSAATAQSHTRTMMGLEDGAPLAEDAAESAIAQAEHTARQSASGQRSATAERVTPARGSRPSGSGRLSTRGSVPGVRRGPSPLVLAFALIAFAAALVLGYLALRPASGPAARVRVVTDEQGESMEFEVPGAAASVKLRFGGQEKPLEAGRVRFLLGPDSLRVGKNVVPYDLVAPGGGVTSGRISLSVDYRVTLDTGPLRAGKPNVDVVVAAVAGSQVWLDGEAIELDAQGRAVRSDVLAPGGTAGSVEHVVRYRVQPPTGEPSLGELRTVIPIATMEIDRPGVQVTTDRDGVEIAGAVDRDASVTVDGQPVPVVAGRFLYRYALPQPGSYQPEVVATVDGKAPHAVQLQVTRVADLAEAAKEFTFDRTLTYAKITQNPTIYRGQRLAFEGRVYNVNVEGGRSALQILVRECPAGQRCPIWVSYLAATEFTVNSWVRVLGVVEGEQQFRSTTDEVKVVPKVEAAFLLPAKP